MSLESADRLSQRLRRVAVIVALLGVAAVIVGLFDGEPLDAAACQGPLQDACVRLPRTVGAGGPSILTFVLFQVVSAMVVYRRPGGPAGWSWMLTTIPITLGGLVIYLGEHPTLLDRLAVMWTGQLVMTLVGAMLLLILGAVPLAILLSTRELPWRAATARLHKG
jgi:hypothetical protein